MTGADEGSLRTEHPAHGIGSITRADPRWSEDMPIFMSPRWLATQSSEYGWLEAHPSSDLHIAVPYVVRRRAGLRWLQFQWGVWASATIGIETERAFLENVVGWCRAARIDFIAQPVTMALFAAAPSGAASVPFGTVLVDLTPAEHAVWTAMDGRNRNNIRKALSENVTVEWGNHLADETHALCAETMARSDLGFPALPQFRAIVESLGTQVDIGIARADGVPMACVVNPWSRYGAHCLYAGNAVEATRGTANLLQWEAMRRAREHGALVYDFVGVRVDPAPGSKYAGIRHFKTRFGGDVVEGCLWKMPLSRWKYGLYKMVKRVQGAAPDIIDQEGQAR